MKVVGMAEVEFPYRGKSTIFAIFGNSVVFSKFESERRWLIKSKCFHRSETGP